MNLQLTRIAAVLSLVLVSAQAMAIPQITKLKPTFMQNGTQGVLIAELIVHATSDLAVMTIGAGFDISCTTSSRIIPIQDKQTFKNFFGASGEMTLPRNGSNTYLIPEYSSIPVGSCGDKECSMDYRAEVVDRPIDFEVTLRGIGVRFELVPSGGASSGNSVSTLICRQGVPQCCQPGCVIP